jgi:hypothetical protein
MDNRQMVGRDYLCVTRHDDMFPRRFKELKILIILLCDILVIAGLTQCDK